MACTPVVLLDDAAVEVREVNGMDCAAGVAANEVAVVLVFLDIATISC